MFTSCVVGSNKRLAVVYSFNASANETFFSLDFLSTCLINLLAKNGLLLISAKFSIILIFSLGCNLLTLFNKSPSCSANILSTIILVLSASSTSTINFCWFFFFFFFSSQLFKYFFFFFKKI